MKVVFFGTPEFAVPSLDALVAAGQTVVLCVAQPDRPAGRGMKMQSPAVAVRAGELALPLAQPERIRGEDFLDQIRGIHPDLGVVVAYGKILPQSLLDIPKHGFLNVHGSILPKYRGAAPIQRAIEAGERETGISIMRVDAEMDHGPVLRIATTPIAADERTPQLAKRLAEIGARALIEVVSDLEQGRAEEREQDHAAATHAPKISKEEGRVEWGLAAQRIYDRFRAFDPWPGIFAIVRGEPVKLTEIAIADQRGEEGSVISLDPFLVAAAEGSINILQVQRPGKRPIAGAEFARVAGLAAGDFFA